MGWDIIPQTGAPVAGMVSVNFPPDLERVQKRLAFGHVEHERKDVRHPEKNTLQAICFEYITKARGNITVTTDHDNGHLQFRLANADGFGVVTTSWPAARIEHLRQRIERHIPRPDLPGFPRRNGRQRKQTLSVEFQN